MMQDKQFVSDKIGMIAIKFTVDENWSINNL